MKPRGLGRQVVAVSEAAFEPSRSRVPKRPRHPSGERAHAAGQRARRDFDRILHEEPF